MRLSQNLRNPLSTNSKIYMSPPDVGALEIQYVIRALESGWVAPLGPEVDGFETDIANYVGSKFAVALSSGSAGIHLGLIALGIEPGDEVVVPTLTFAATAFSVVHAQAVPVFIDSEGDSFNIDPNALREFLDNRSRINKLPKVVIAVDIFGQSADYDNITKVCEEFDVPLLVDAAESLGSFHKLDKTGIQGKLGIFSFNGNKIMTTSGGGMLVTNDEKIANKVRYLSTQARSPQPWYEHEEIGFNFRMSNVLAAIGRAQLLRLDEMIDRRKQIRKTYTETSLDSNFEVIQDASWTTSNSWLTLAKFNDAETVNRLAKALEADNIESRPVWKPMHMQPIFSKSEFVGGTVAENLFEKAICLPSGSKLTDEEVQRVVDQLVSIG